MFVKNRAAAKNCTVTKNRAAADVRRESAGVRFLYGTAVGRVMLKAFVRPTVSKIFGRLMDSRASALFIRGFVRRNKINMRDYEDVKYRSFNEFFSRKIKSGRREFAGGPHELCAPCDAKLTAYPITAGGAFRIKNSLYGISDLLCDNALADEYAGGTCLVFRLTPDDYHRYSYVDDGVILRCEKIRGILHSVRPVALERNKVYVRNTREYTVMQTVNFGKVVQVEVGALLVGRVKNHAESGAFKRGEEKGVFEYGGSTIVMLFERGRVRVDEAVINNSRHGLETVVRQGCRIGEADAVSDGFNEIGGCPTDD